MNKLVRKIREKDTELTIRKLEGELQLPRNPFSRTDLTFDYSKIDPIYYASSNPEEEITLYKGALRDCEDEGFLSLALRRGLVDHVNEVREMIESGDAELIRDLFDIHTSYYRHTALLSATFNPEQAQVFAPTISRGEDKTIYQLRINADRCVIDWHDTGSCGYNGELLILGAIFPEEITAVKIINEDLYSELFNDEGFISWFPNKDSRNRDVKDPSNWRYLAN